MRSTRQPNHDPHTTRRATRALAAGLLAATGLCGCAVGATRVGPEVASEADWRALRQPRPTPLPGAARITLSAVRFGGAYPWPDVGHVDAELGITELVAANLLRRRDLDFVERRRFVAAAEAERRREPRPPGRPPAGVSRSAEYGIVAHWMPDPAGGDRVEIRLSRLETGEVEEATRVPVTASTGPVGLARAIVGGVVEALERIDRRPSWSDPLVESAANTGGGARVSTEALRHFLSGLAAEETWNWEGARRGYQQAIEEDSSFHEARTALARAARLRLGGTLAESQ